MKINSLQLIVILLTIGITSVAGISAVFAEGHESDEGHDSDSHEMEESPAVSGWFQVDVDSLGTYFLIGASHPVGGLSIASNIYINDNHKDKYTGELDLGVTVPVIANDTATLLLQPMVGIGFDYKTVDGPDSLYPQVFAFLNAGKIFFFHWTIMTYSSIFDDTVINELYTRNYLTYSLSDIIAIGPQFERVQGLGENGALWSQTIGVRLNTNYGKNNTLGIYVGYDTEKGDEDSGLTGRMNFTRLW